MCTVLTKHLLYCTVYIAGCKCSCSWKGAAMVMVQDIVYAGFSVSSMSLYSSLVLTCDCSVFWLVGGCSRLHHGISHARMADIFLLIASFCRYVYLKYLSLVLLAFWEILTGCVLHLLEMSSITRILRKGIGHDLQIYVWEHSCMIVMFTLTVYPQAHI